VSLVAAMWSSLRDRKTHISTTSRWHGRRRHSHLLHASRGEQPPSCPGRAAGAKASALLPLRPLSLPLPCLRWRHSYRRWRRACWRISMDGGDKYDQLTGWPAELFPESFW